MAQICPDGTNCGSGKHCVQTGFDTFQCLASGQNTSSATVHPTPSPSIFQGLIDIFAPPPAFAAPPPPAVHPIQKSTSPSRPPKAPQSSSRGTLTSRFQGVSPTFNQLDPTSTTSTPDLGGSFSSIRTFFTDHKYLVIAGVVGLIITLLLLKMH